MLFISMIYLTKGQTSDVIVTLKEKQTLAAPNYLFYFINRSSNDEVAFLKLNNTDISTHKDRYNKFSINATTYFSNQLAGEWTYYIYEQASTSNLDPALAAGLLETGILRLDDSSTFEFTEYETNNTFKVR
jgi:hypothetical protein